MAVRCRRPWAMASNTTGNCPVRRVLRQMQFVHTDEFVRISSAHANPQLRDLCREIVLGPAPPVAPAASRARRAAAPSANRK